VAHVAVGGEAETAAAARCVEAEAEGIQEPVRGVAEAREVEGDGEVVVMVHLPAIHDATIRLEPAAHSVFSFAALRIRPFQGARGADLVFRQSVAYTSPEALTGCKLELLHCDGPGRRGPTSGRGIWATMAKLCWPLRSRWLALLRARS